MAAFKNQFSKQSPFDLPLRPEFFGWPSQIAIEATAIISSKDITWLTAVANQLERVIRKAAESPNPKATERLNTMPYFAAMFKQALNISPQDFRDMYGDFNLLMDGHDSHEWEAELVKSTESDRFSVFCLWKLVDAHTELGPLECPKDVERGGAYTIEAMSSLQTAQMILMQMRTATKRSKKSNEVKTLKAQRNKKAALEMANSMYFSDIDDAAHHVAGHFKKGIDADGRPTTYSEQYMKRILQSGKWIKWKSPDGKD
jgi:hypothetical protein